jgi:hypothetical protein
MHALDLKLKLLIRCLSAVADWPCRVLLRNGTAAAAAAETAAEQARD